MAVRGNLGLGGANDPRPRGSLVVSEARELLVTRSIPGAFNPDRTVAEDTLRIVTEAAIRPGRVPNEMPDEEVVRVRDEEVVWGGHVMRHYGHFLVESVSRLWPVLPGAELDGRPVVFATPRRLPFVLEWLEAFGARTVELPERGVVRFTR